MADTNFVDNDLSLANRIVAAWLNDVNNLRYGADSAARGAALLQFIQSGTGAVARTAQDKMREIVSVTDFAAVGDGVTDDTAAIQAWATACAGKRGYIPAPSVAYLITDTITVSSHRTNLFGDGQQATKFLFNPSTTGKAAFHFTGNTIVQCSLRGVSFDATGNTQGTKAAIRVTDGEEIILDDIAVSNWTSAGKDCVGIQTRGRQTHSIGNVTLDADIPISVEDNPNSGIDIDHYHFYNLYLIADSNPCIKIADGVNLTHVTFGGYQAWVGGTHGLYWVDTTTSSVSMHLKIANVRSEQGSSASSDQIHIEHNQELQGLVLENCRGGSDRDGIYLRKVSDVLLLGYQYSGTGVALDADSTVNKIRGIGCFWLAGSTATLSGQRLIWGVPKSPNTGALPPDFYYDRSANTAIDITSEANFTGLETTIAQDAAQSIGTATLLAGMLFVTTDEDSSAIYMLRGATATVAEVSDPDGFFTVTKDNAATYNIYYESPNYYIQNKRTGSHVVRWKLIGGNI